MGIEGRVAVITGSARNIGRQCALLLASQGAKVIVNARTRDKVDEVVEEIRKAGGQALPSYHSVETKEGADSIIADAVRGFGTVDILVNNAAISMQKPTHELTDDEWNRVINTDITAFFRMTRAAVPYMMEKRWGRIINMSSHAGLQGTARRTAYATAKAGILGFTKSIAKEYGAYGITANAIAPLTLRDEDVDAAGMPLPAGTPGAPERVPGPDNMGARVVLPTGRVGPVTVAPMVAFFASEEAWYITGQTISVAGGAWMG